MPGYRPGYTVREDILILKSIIEAKAFYDLRGKVFWEGLAMTGLFDRTWQSLKERFTKEILPNIYHPKYGIPEAHKRIIKSAYDQLK